MRSYFLAKIRIDQSHCNHHLAKFLSANGWAIHFKDAGRVSRGGAGLQGAMLQLFEENSLPIPDLVAVKESSLMFVEIDSAYSKVKRSLQIYRKNQDFLLDRCNAIFDTPSPIKTLELNYCRMGESIEHRKEAYIQQLDLNIVTQFTIFIEPRSPIVYALAI